MSPTLRLPLRPSMSPKKFLTPTPILQIAADYVRDGDQFGISVALFGGCSIVGAPYSENMKGRAYLYKIVLWGWGDSQTMQASDGSDGEFFGGSVSTNEKTVVVRAPYKDNDGAVYEFTLQGETWKEEKKLTASDGVLGDNFVDSMEKMASAEPHMCLSLQETDRGTKEQS